MGLGVAAVWLELLAVGLDVVLEVVAVGLLRSLANLL
jgi:hypothetical protein